MASSSNPSPLNFTHDVFVSYMHEDTGNSFTSHLKSAFDREGFNVAMNDTVDKGKEISDTLLSKVFESLVYVVIFSKRYASSLQCLDELVKIWESKEEENGRRVLPVFLGVEPTHVRNQTGAFGDGFQRLIESKQFKEKEETWKSALRKTANLSGWDSMVKSEAEILEAVVKCIKKTLDQLPSTNYSNGFVGIYQVEEVESLLQLQSRTNVQFLGIWGMGGIGKTRISKELHSRISSLFDATCYLENVRQKLESMGLQFLSKEIFSQLGIDFKPSLPRSTQRALNRKRVLLILDDVSNSQSLMSFVKNLHCGSGSRIILTCRDKQLLSNYQCEVYEVQKLDSCESLKLFEFHAFKGQLCHELYGALLNKALLYCGGLPLALELLGCNLYNKNFEEWESELEKLENIPNPTLNDVMKISYLGLDENEKSIFLDIACVFCGWDETAVKKVFDACKLYAVSGISHLIDKALITISNGKLRMHDLVQQFGQYMVFFECKEEPGNRSRLWRFEDLSHVVARNTGSEKVEVISVDLNQGRRKMYMKPEFFEKMVQLRVLNLHVIGGPGIIDLLRDLSSLPNKLSYLRWDYCPLTSFPQMFTNKRHLVELRFSNSHLKQLWTEGTELNLPLLECMDLSCSKDLIKLPDLSKCPNLKTLDAHRCGALVEIPSSIQHLCKLQTLNMWGCNNLATLPVLPQSIVSLDLGATNIKELPSSIGSLSQLQELDLRCCSNATSLPESFGLLKCLESLDLCFCPNLTNLPESSRSLQSLKNLKMIYSGIRNIPSSFVLGLVSLEIMDLSGTDLESLPTSIEHLSCLTKLYLKECKNLKYLPFLPSSLKVLNANECTSLRIEGDIFGLSLIKIHLCGTDVESLPASIKHLSRLKELHLEECKNLKSLPDLPSSLEVLDTNGCSSLTTVGNIFGEYDGRSFWFNMGGCFNLDQNSRITYLAYARAGLNASETFPRYIDVRNKLSLPMGNGFCIPGSEVPDWFKDKAEGSSIEVALLLEHLNKLAFCILIDDCSNIKEMSSCSLWLQASCKCMLVTEFGERGTYLFPNHIHNIGGTSKHVILWAVKKTLSFNQIIQKFSSPRIKAKFEFKAHSWSEKSKCKITHCGVSPLGNWKDLYGRRMQGQYEEEAGI